MTITHQDISDRMDALGREHSAAYKLEVARIDKERASLQELCGRLGHFFKRNPLLPLSYRGRCCVFCGTAETA
jgi:hypothetical protein